jgi:hypothetical protein
LKLRRAMRNVLHLPCSLLLTDRAGSTRRYSGIASLNIIHASSCIKLFPIFYGGRVSRFKRKKNKRAQ